MEHVVFSAAEGGIGEEFRRVSSLAEAVRVVEHLRNDLGIAESSVYELTEVPLEFKAYYRVEVPSVKMPVAKAALTEAPPAFVSVPPELSADAELPLDGLRVGELTEPAPAEPAADESYVVAPDVASVADPELADQELSDEDYLPDLQKADPSVPSLLPPVTAIPPTRQDADAERSLGYFAR